MNKLLSFTLGLMLLLISGCIDNDIIIEKSCTEPSDFSPTDVKMFLTTSISIERTFKIERTGYFKCENIPVKQDSLNKNISFHGFICKDNIVEMFIDFNDSLTNSKIKVNVKQTSPYSFSGKIYYCSNENNVCDYSEIGFVIGGITEKYQASFVTPIFSGLVEVFILNGSGNRRTDL
ncbi:MAG TPA: hypothetical protein PKA39_12370 [Ignavibacteria bacterium]|nr:hypothetical protein [Ignavibacteria bacterium]